MKQYSDKVIILRRTDYGEKDRILQVLGSSLGQSTVMAKSVRSQKSKLAGSIELLSVIDMQLVGGKGDMYTLTGARLIEHYPRIAQNLDAMEVIKKSLQTIDRLCSSGSGSEYFNILETTLCTLNDDGYDFRIIWIWFCLNALEISGVSPSFDVSDSAELFSFDHGRQEFIAHSSGTFTRDELKLLRILASNNKPIKLSKELGTETKLQQFATQLLKTNLTEV